MLSDTSMLKFPGKFIFVRADGGSVAVEKVALSVMLICWQQHATVTPASPTITFDMDEALYKDQMPLASVNVLKDGKSAEGVK
ncbi:hypothetical protein Aduo_011483 [Ancylostoma duodenale]